MPFNDDMQVFFKPKVDMVITNNNLNCISEQQKPEWIEFLLYLQKIGFLEYQRRCAESEKEIYVVLAYQNNEPVGYAKFQRIGKTNQFSLDSMYTDPLLRFRGIGGKMLEEVKSYVKSLGATELVLIDLANYKMPWMDERSISSTQAPSIYDDHGFEHGEFECVKRFKF